MLIVIVGRSGAGKSTFVEGMGLPATIHCVLSRPMIEELQKRGVAVSHDTISALAKEWYAANRWWQLEYLLEEAGGKSLVVVDGLRYAFELKRLRGLFGDMLLVRVVATPEARFQRLKARGKVPLSSLVEFERLEADEGGDMNIEEIMAQADISVENIGPREELLQKAVRFGALIKRLL